MIKNIQSQDLNPGNVEHLEDERNNIDTINSIVEVPIEKTKPVIQKSIQLTEQQKFEKENLSEKQYNEVIKLNLDLTNYKKYIRKNKLRKDGTGMLIAGGAIGGFGLIYTLYTGMNRIELDRDRRQASVLVGTVSVISAIPLIIGGATSLSKSGGIKIIERGGKELGVNLNYSNDSYKMAFDLNF